MTSVEKEFKNDGTEKREERLKDQRNLFQDVRPENGQVIEENRGNDIEDPQEGPSGNGINSNVSLRDVSNDEIDTVDTRIQRYENYLERYGPHLERYGNQLERFGNQLERIRPNLEKCGSNLERYGPQLEALSRQLERNCSLNESNLPVRSVNIQAQSENHNEPITSQGADLSSHLWRQGQWISQNPRRLSRRPSFQVNGGLIRHWIERRDVDNRDIQPRFRGERRRSNWRNNGEIREHRRSRVILRPENPGNNHPENSQNNLNENNNRSVGTQMVRNSEQQNQRFRNEEIHQDDPNFGFVIVDHQNSPGPSSQSDTDSPSPLPRRPRSNMSLRPLNYLTPRLIGPIIDSDDNNNDDSDEDANHPRANHQMNIERRSRRREGNPLRSLVMMNNYFQLRPLFIGQGDSKGMGGRIRLQQLPFDDPLYHGNDRVSRGN